MTGQKEMNGSHRQSDNPGFVRPERYRNIDNAVSYNKHIRSSNPGRRLSYWLEMHALKRALNRLLGQGVLDSPCGTGRIHDILISRFSSVISLDSSESMLKVHKHSFGEGSLCCGDIFNLPFPDSQFDWTVCYRLFHHMQGRSDRIRLLESLSRVSKMGVIFTAWVDTPFNKRRGSRRRSLKFDEIEGIVSEAGLHLTKIDYASWPFQPKCVLTCTKTPA